LTKSATGILDGDQLHCLWKAADIVGDIAILKIPGDLGTCRSQIAENLLNVAPYVKVVLAQVGPVGSQLRTRKLEWLAGEKRTDTLYRESGCQFRFDLSAVYFSPRLSHERKRIADLVSPGECVVNFFAGVGSFSIIIARYARPSRIYSLDINPIAIRYHLMNNVLNGVDGIIDVICGDANDIAAASLVGCADRVLLPLPELALGCLPTARGALKNGHGIIHCYVFVDGSQRKEASSRALLKVIAFLNSVGAAPESTQAHVVRSVGPCRYQVCLDMKV
jgi:tRNA (guanine37-N1)-methyltransferase